MKASQIRNELRIDTPVGRLRLVASDKGLQAIEVGRGASKSASKEITALDKKASMYLASAKKQLDEYFSGKRKEFDVALDLQGTEFQVRAWKALCRIPYGKTISYGQQAKSIQNPKAFRAVGSANGRNPIPIIVPCHRVIAGDGTLGGYSSGLKMKEQLLDLESR